MKYGSRRRHSRHCHCHLDVVLCFFFLPFYFFVFIWETHTQSLLCTHTHTLGGEKYGYNNDRPVSAAAAAARGISLSLSVCSVLFCSALCCECVPTDQRPTRLKSCRRNRPLNTIWIRKQQKAESRRSYYWLPLLKRWYKNYPITCASFWPLFFPTSFPSSCDAMGRHCDRRQRGSFLSYIITLIIISRRMKSALCSAVHGPSWVSSARWCVSFFVFAFVRRLVDSCHK